MTKLLLGVLLLGSCIAQANQPELPLGNPNLLKDLEKAVKAFERSCGDLVSVGNGDCGTRDINVKSLDLTVEAASEVANLSDAHQCSFDARIEDNANTASEELDDVTDEFRNILETIQASGQLIGVVNAGWDGGRGDSEYCSVYTTQIYLKNGKVLYVNGDYTD